MILAGREWAGSMPQALKNANRTAPMVAAAPCEEIALAQATADLKREECSQDNLHTACARARDRGVIETKRPMPRTIDAGVASDFLQRLHAAVSAQDPDAVASLCAENVVWGHPAAQHTLHGREVVRSLHRYISSSRSRTRVSS